MISQTAEYALRAVTCLAAAEGGPLTARQIATLTRVPAGYLAKVLQSLVRSGLVESTRGVHGGFRLARRPQEMSILDVVQAVDPLQRIRDCPLHLKAHRHRLCALHRRLDDAMRHIEEILGAASISDLLDEAEPVRPLRDASQVFPE
ncbi:MAG: Rrf2 family transcriptional regulator [Planctomycetes bacterium]|nr:Rrf2 family transcriptional regulator [Planctomycetota bacterium]